MLRYCLQCGKEITSKTASKFCSHSCSAKYSNIRRAKKEKRKCPVCGRDILNPASKYCSLDCFQKAEYDRRIDEWLSGNFTKEDGVLPAHIRKYLMIKHNCSCQECGWNKRHPISNEVPLQVHHINGDCTDNRPDNLQLLCPNCHSLTENYGSRNKGSKRKSYIRMRQK